MMRLHYEQESLLQNSNIAQNKTLSIYHLILEGGVSGQIIIGVLLLLLVISSYIYLERLFAIKTAKTIDKNFMNQIKDYILNNNLEAAKHICLQNDIPVSNLIRAGISRIGKPLEDINFAIENTGKLEIYKLEKNISVIATISGVAPMIGFLGTVIGMIISIHQIANSGGQIDIKLLADGLYTAMTTTVGGLIVGIISYAGYNHLVVKTNKIVYEMEVKSVEFLDLLNEPI